MLGPPVLYDKIAPCDKDTCSTTPCNFERGRNRPQRISRCLNKARLSNSPGSVTIPTFVARSRKKFYPVNEKIKDAELRVIDPSGENLGVMARDEALAKANAHKLDLVVISAAAAPPVAKILDFGKFLFDKRKERADARKGKRPDTKTLRFKPNIGDGDLQVRIKRARQFLQDGNKVKFEIPFFGRMIMRKEVGHAKLDHVLEELSDVAEVEKKRWMDGRRLLMMVKPK